MFDDRDEAGEWEAAARPPGSADWGRATAGPAGSTDGGSADWTFADWGASARAADADEWAWPGRPDVASPPAQPDPAARALCDAVDALLATPPADLPGPVALDRARQLLGQADRLALAVGAALLDVQARELYAADAAGSVWAWLRRQPAGEGGRIGRARRLAARPLVQTAVATGSLGIGAADLTCRMLEQLPDHAEPGQVEGVLRHAVPALLASWTAGDAGADPTLAAARARTVANVVAEGLAATAMSPADRLEPAFTLISQALPAAVLNAQLQLIVDALAPEPAHDTAERAYQDRSLRLRKKTRSGWRLTGDLTDEVGHALHAHLHARAQARSNDQSRLQQARDAAGSTPTEATGSTGSGGTPAAADLDAFGTVGPGRPHPDSGDGAADRHPAADGDPAAASDQCAGPQSDPQPLTDPQLTHDLFGQLLADLEQVTNPGVPRPAQITIIADLNSVENALGALPGTLLSPTGPTSLTPAQLRRAGCHGQLAAVLLDAARTPIGASGTHRHATDRERRALHAQWGMYCAEDGCPDTRTIPHHAEPWWKTRQTRLADLVPLCHNSHHALHDGRRTLRLRDGRYINENGWTGPPDPNAEST